jgi:hypothetical protein
MTQHPYGSDELDRMDPELDTVALELERYAAARSADPPSGLAAIVKDAIADEPVPVIGWWHHLLAGPVAWGATGRSIAVAAVVLLLLVGSVAVGQLLDVTRPSVGSSPSPVISPSERPTPSYSPSPSPSPSVSPTPSQAPSTPAATPGDDDGGGGGGGRDDESPEPSNDDNSGPGGGADNETPEPNDDNSGPGGGGGDDD